MRLRRMSGCLLFALSVVLAAPAADAHAKLVQSMPAADSAAPTPPKEIRLTFNEPITANLSGIDLTTAEGGKVNVGPAAAESGDGMSFVVPIIDPLPPGSYRVLWRTVSADMHKLEGDFAFEVQP